MPSSSQFSHPFSLCPLIDYKNFLGVTEDSLNDCVIVTLSKNMVIRFRLSDQKQISSWGTKNKLTAPVVYDHFNNRYIGVFNGDEVSFWQVNCEQLNKLKKFKFTWLIHSIVSSKNVAPHIVYMNGNISPLNVDRNTRKDTEGKDFLETSENIENVQLINMHGHPYVALLVVNVNASSRLYLVPLTEDQERFSVKLDRNDGVELLGHTLIESSTSASTTFLRFWSNGDLTAVKLSPNKGDVGKVISTLTVIDTTKKATLFPISEEVVIIHGSNTNSEDGILVMFSLKYNAVGALENLKTYIPSSKYLGRTRELILPSGGNLMVVPYKPYKPRLSALVGSLAPKLQRNMDEQILKNIPQQRSCGVIFEKKKIKAEEVVNLLQKCNDMPDEYILQSLAYAMLNKSQICNQIIELVLSTSLVGDDKSTKLIKTHVPLQMTLELFQILTAEVPNNILKKPTKLQNKILLSWARQDTVIDWITYLIKGYHQEFFSTNATDVIDALNKLTDSVNSQWELKKKLKLLKLKKKKKQVKISKNSLVSSVDYSIETIQLY